jgi:hypothetical protein
LILDSQNDSKKQQIEIRSLLDPDSWFLRGFEKIEFCECGYPIVGVYKDSSKGPINDLVYFTKVGSYTSKYHCPSCDSYIMTITQ